MANTYLNRPGTGDEQARKDAVRFALGDTATPWDLSDEEIYYLLDQSNDDIQRAAIKGAQKLIAKYSGGVNKKIGKLSISGSDRVKHYKELLATLQSEGSILAAPVAGGLTKSGKDDMADDEDAVQPAFEREQDDHPGNDDSSRWGQEGWR